MNRRFVLAVLIGVLTQIFTLRLYSWLAVASPQSPLKYLGVAVLFVGSAGAAQLLMTLPRRAVVSGFLLMALAAPFVPLIGSPKAGELLSDLSYYAPIYGKAFAIVFACYLVLWGALVALNTLRQKPVR